MTAGKFQISNKKKSSQSKLTMRSIQGASMLSSKGRQASVSVCNSHSSSTKETVAPRNLWPARFEYSSRARAHQFLPRRAEREDSFALMERKMEACISSTIASAVWKLASLVLGRRYATSSLKTGHSTIVRVGSKLTAMNLAKSWFATSRLKIGCWLTPHSSSVRC